MTRKEIVTRTIISEAVYRALHVEGLVRRPVAHAMANHALDATTGGTEMSTPPILDIRPDMAAVLKKVPDSTHPWGRRLGDIAVLSGFTPQYTRTLLRHLRTARMVSWDSIAHWKRTPQGDES